MFYLAALLLGNGSISFFNATLAVGEPTCTATSQVTFTPGLRLFERETDITLLM